MFLKLMLLLLCVFDTCKSKKESEQIRESTDLILKIARIADFNSKFNEFAVPVNTADRGFIQEIWHGF